MNYLLFAFFFSQDDNVDHIIDTKFSLKEKKKRNRKKVLFQQKNGNENKTDFKFLWHFCIKETILYYIVTYNNNKIIVKNDM